MTPKQDVATPTRPGPAKPVRRRWTVSPVQEPADAVEPAEPSEAAEAAEVAETAADTVEAPAVVAPVSERRTWRWVAAAVAVLAVLGLGATAGLQAMAASQARDSLSQLQSDRQLRLDVSGVAKTFGQTLLSYDYQDLQRTRTALLAMATGDFRNTYDEAFGGAMAQVIVKLKAVSQATVREVYLADVDESTAHAIVVVDQQVKTDQAIRSVKDSHLKITMVKQDGAWKVQDVTVLGAAKEDQYDIGTDKKKK